MKYLFFSVLLSIFGVLSAQNTPVRTVDFEDIVPGDARFDAYLPLLQGKNTALVVNHSSLVHGVHLVDTLQMLGVSVTKIFTPEHGYRGTVSEGKYIANSTTSGENIPVISLYGKKKKPSAEDLKGVDILLFDLQDVGARFYTYISTMSLVMEACAESDIPVVVLDRPNPNGFYVDGPVLKPQFRSFVGMHPVPVVYGMTIGEYALMVNGEKWLKNGISCKLTVIPLKKYDHNMIVKLPVKPSPNLPDWHSVYLYPSLCFFEGTVVSVGRGTATPFQMYGHPGLKNHSYTFVPRSNEVSTHPKLEGKRCYGQNLKEYADNFASNPRQIHLKWLLDAYRQLGPGNKFFLPYFEKLAGTGELRKQIESGQTETQIRASWQNDLKKFKHIRKKYLLYP